MAVHHNRPYLVIPHDGYTWLKYGQKILSHTKLTRAYFRCANFKIDLCPARKFVDFNHRDPGGEPPRLTYQNEHTHPPMNPAFAGPVHAPPDPGGAPISDGSDASVVKAHPTSQVQNPASGPSQILMKDSQASTSKEPAGCQQGPRSRQHTPGQGEELQSPGGESKPVSHSEGQRLDLRDDYRSSSQAGGVLTPKTEHKADMQDPAGKQGTPSDCAAMSSGPAAAESQGGRLLSEGGLNQKGEQGGRPENRLDSPQSSSWLAGFDLGRTESGCLDWGAPSETVDIQETDLKEADPESREALPVLERAAATKDKGERHSIDASSQIPGKRMKLGHGFEGQGTREDHPAEVNRQVHPLGYGTPAKEGHNREQWKPPVPGSEQQSQGLQEICQWSSTHPSMGANDSRTFLQGIPNQQGLLWAGNHPQQQMQTHYQPSANMTHGQETQSSHVLTQPSSLMVGPSGPQASGSNFHLGPAPVESQPPVLQPGSWSFRRTPSAERDQRFSMNRNRIPQGMNSSGVTQPHQQNRFQQRTQEQRLLQHPQAQSGQDFMPFPQDSARTTHALGNQPPFSSQQIPGGHMSQAQNMSTGIAPQVWNTSSNAGMQGIGQDFSMPLMPVQNASLQFRGTAENSAQNQYFPPQPSAPAHFSRGPPPPVWLPDDATRQALHVPSPVPQVWCNNVPYNTPCNTNHGMRANQVPPSHVGPTCVPFQPPVSQSVPQPVMHMGRHPHEGGHHLGQGNETTCMTCNPQPYSAAPIQSSLDAAQLHRSTFNAPSSGAVSNPTQYAVSSQHWDSTPGPILASSTASTGLLSPPPMGWSRSSEHM